MKMIIPTDKSFDEIVKDKINPLAIQWLIDKSIHDRFDGSAKAFLQRACNLANIYKEDLLEIYDNAKAEAALVVEKSRKGKV